MGAAMAMILYWIEVKLGWREWDWRTLASRITVGAVTRSFMHGLGSLGQVLWLIRARSFLEKIGFSARLIRSARYLLMAKGFFLNSLVGKAGLKEGKGWLYIRSWTVPVYNFVVRRLRRFSGKKK